MSEVIAFFACAICVVNSAPQILKIFITGQALGVAYTTYVMLTFGAMLWILYAFTVGSVVILAWNAIGGFLTLSVIFIKFFSEEKA